MPLVSKTFDQLLDFTRTSAATFVGSNGLIQNTPASVNLMLQTQQFDNAIWTKINSSVTANSTVAPDGTSTADKLVEDTANTGHETRQLVTVAAGPYTYSVYLKAGERSFAMLFVNNGNVGTVFDLSNGTTAGNAGFTAPTAASITSVGNGWYRCSITLSATAASSSFRVFIMQNSTTYSYTGDGTSGIYVWGAQLEAVPDANLVLGSELRGTGTVGLVGTATAASYNTGTGAGAVTRVDASNQSYVQFTGLTNAQVYRVVISCDSGVAIAVRSGPYSGSGQVVSPGSSVALYVTPASNLITVTSNGGTSTFTLTSIREYLGVTGMPSTYTRNNGGVFPPRFDYDPVTLAAKGLLIEEQRTNLVLQSQTLEVSPWGVGAATITANATTAPDGTMTADKLVENTADTFHRVFQVPTLTNVPHTFTVYAKAAERNWLYIANASASQGAYFNLSTGVVGTIVGAATATITPAGNGWYRCSTTSTPSAGAQNYSCYLANADNSFFFTGDGTSGIFLWGAQLEAGAFATSYIPTVASQVTRTGDNCAIVAPNFAPWYNQSEGTFVAEFDVLSVANTKQNNIVALYTTGTNDMRIWLWEGQPTIVRWSATNGTTQADINSSAVTANTVIKSAAAYKSNDFAASFNGAATVTDTSATVPTGFSLLNIGTYTGPTGTMCGHIRSIRYYPVRLSNTQLQALTS